jgi:primosomal protein N' (replication factor Y) (superfamily II helicase)
MATTEAQKGGRVDNSGAVQLSLLQGFVAKERKADPHSGVVLASRLPVAKVLVESSLPHLDRLFDYSVPAELDDVALPGVRVKVRFAGQELPGYLTERTDASDSPRLTPLGKVVSPVRVLTPEVLALAEAVAARYAGSVSDVLRVAIPPRVARLEKALTAAAVPPVKAVTAADSGPVAAGTGAAAAGGGAGLTGYRNGPAFLSHVAAGGSPRAVLTALQGYGASSWHAQVASAIASCYSSGRGAVAVVPDQRDLELLERAVAAVLPAGSYVRLTADDGPTPRYSAFLSVLQGTARVVLGTRSAAFAPVRDPGLFVCWDDGDDLHVERRAPYQHSRDVLLLRAEASNAALLLAGHTRSTEAQRLLATGWAQPIVPERTLTRVSTPRVVSTADSFEQERDPLAGLARLPQRAWQTAKDALGNGPVLVQVARTGYAASLACQRCRELARCTHCSGPLMEPARHRQEPGGPGAGPQLLQCRWCGTAEPAYACPVCGSRHLRRLVVGASRTAEELGRAFPGVPVISSAGEHVKPEVPDEPALVVATVGAEPLAPGGYAAALLLDGNTLLRRESLRASEDTLRRWLNAAALVRPAREGGIVVVTAEESSVVGALVRWDPAGFAERELEIRQELGLPPAVRIASLTGGQQDVNNLVAQLQLPPAVRVVGPAPVPAAPGPAGEQSPEYRTLMFFPYSLASAVTGRLRASKASNAAKRSGSAVQVRCDGLDVL